MKRIKSWFKSPVPRFLDGTYCATCHKRLEDPDYESFRVGITVPLYGKEVPVTLNVCTSHA